MMGDTTYKSTVDCFVKTLKNEVPSTLQLALCYCNILREMICFICSFFIRSLASAIRMTYGANAETSGY